MATAEEILAGMAAEETQQVLVIDNDLRTIAIPEGVTLLGVTSDDDVRRLRFAMPRMCGEFDLSAFALRINYLNAGSEGDVYPVADAEVDGDTIRFSWLVGRHACKYKGDVRFIVCAKLLGDGGEIEKEFNTTLATLPVLEGLETGEAVVQANPDVIEGILERLDTCTTPPVMSVNGQTGAVALGAGDVGARPDTWTPTAADVGADAAGTALARVGAHNTSGEAHADMRALIDAVTTGKVSTSDIVDNLTTNASGKVLSAAQGVALKALIDAIVIPDKLPNPQPLTINGQRYDGSSAVEVTVTGEGGGANIDDTTPGSTTTYSSQKIESELDALKDETGVQNYTYSGRDLSVVFGTLSALHAAVSAGDFSKIRVGDYWPITLNGSIKDYASGETKTLSNAVFKMEVAPQVYRNYGDTAVPNHLLMCSRDLLPWTLMYRSENTTWYDEAQTNPWLGSHLYQTLNAADGILPLVEAIFGSYMYAGPNGKGMRFLLETKAKDAANVTGWGWGDRGKLFLPTEREAWGQDVWSEHSYGGGVAVQWPMFIGSLKHIIKGLGNGGSRCTWWCQSSLAGSAAHFTNVDGSGLPGSYAAALAWLSAPLCFLLV